MCRADKFIYNLSINPPSQTNQSIFNNQTFSIVDSDMTGNYLHAKAPILNKIQIKNGPTMILPDDTAIKAFHKGILDLPPSPQSKSMLCIPPSGKIIVLHSINM